MQLNTTEGFATHLVLAFLKFNPGIFRKIFFQQLGISIPIGEIEPELPIVGSLSA